MKKTLQETIGDVEANKMGNGKDAPQNAIVVTFLPENKKIIAPITEEGYGGEGDAGSILDLALANGIEIEHACGGFGACGTCHIKVKEGKELLSPAEPEEEDVLDSVSNVGPDSRLACKAVIKKPGKLTVEIQK